jgi:hypothetical protein
VLERIAEEVELYKFMLFRFEGAGQKTRTVEQKHSFSLAAAAHAFTANFVYHRLKSIFRVHFNPFNFSTAKEFNRAGSHLQA